MDALKIDKAHIVGHSMGAATALHVGINYPERCISVTAAGCGYGSSPDPKVVEEGRAASRETGEACLPRESMAVTAPRYADGATRQTHKIQRPARLRRIRQDAERTFVDRPCADHAAFAGQAADVVGHGSGPEEVQAAAVGAGWRRGWLVPRFQRVPEAHRADRRTLVIPRSGHTITSEEPAAFNAALADLFANAEAGGG